MQTAVGTEKKTFIKLADLKIFYELPPWTHRETIFKFETKKVQKLITNTYI